MTGGSITLVDVASRASVLDVACTRCERAGRHGLTTLISRYGRSYGIPALLRELSADCPKRESVSAYDLCGIYCSELSTHSWRRVADRRTGLGRCWLSSTSLDGVCQGAT
jgi:hypothetical protein